MSNIIDLNIAESLKEFGLSDKEARVYMTLLQSGEVSAVRLSRETELHRQFVYNALSALKEKGLVLQLGTPTRALWRAQTPRKFIALAEEQELKAAKIADQLLALMHKKTGQEFTLTEGTQAFRLRSIENIRKTPVGATVLMICGQWSKYFARMGERAHEEWERIRIGKEIHFNIIGPRSFTKAMEKESTSRTFTNYRIFPGLEENLVNTVIYPNHIDFEMYGDPHITFSLKNPDVVGSQKHFFEALWKKSEEL